MNKEKLASLTIGLIVLLTLSTIAASLIFANLNNDASLDALRVACVGDSLTQSTVYPYELSLLLGKVDYKVGNFGVGSTTVSLDSQTPYMKTSTFQNALEFKPDLVIIMLGTNDAQPSLHQYNTSFVDDYVKLISAFQMISSEPKIWITLPPPIFYDQGGKISPEYFKNTIIPCIKQVAIETNLPIIDVYSALANYSDHFPDGVHPNSEGGKLIAVEIYKALKP